MQKAMSYWGPDGKFIWHEENAAFGQLQLYNTQESLNERFPLFDNDRGIVFLSAARIDNREDLFQQLEISASQRAAITDAEIIFAAYKKWGKDCVHHLIGDWSFAVWDSNSKELFLARDHHGISGIYYYSNNDFLAFASSLKSLLALPHVPKKVNELQIAQVHISWTDDGIQTAYSDILRLPPSHFLTVKNGAVEKVRYHYFENIKPLNYKNDEDYIEHFKELFTEAVSCRLRTHKKVGSTLSSGLDSSSVSAVAANLLKQKNVRLPVFTSVPLYDCQDQVPQHRLANEGPLAAKLVEFNGNMDHYLLDSKNVSVLNGILRTLWIHDQPVHAAANAYWIVDLMENAKRMGCNVLLTGQFGNGTISWPTAQYTNKYLAPKWPEFTLQNLMDLKLFKKKIATPIIPAFLLSYYLGLKSGPRPWENHSALDRSFADRIQLKKLMKEAGFDPSFSGIKDISKMQIELIKPGEAIVGQKWQENGAEFGIEVRDPSMDKRIIEFCLGVPDRVYIKNGNGRMLIREAMKGIVPHEILWSKQRGLQGADVNYRISKEKERWLNVSSELVQNSLAPSILDLKKINTAIEGLTNIKQLNSRFVSIASRGLMTKLWLEQQTVIKNI